MTFKYQLKQKFVFALSLLLLPSLAWAQSLSTYERKIRFENDVVRQIHSDLTPLVGPGVYQVAVQVELNRTKELQGQEILRSSLSRRSKQELLPGFKDYSSKKKGGAETLSIYKQIEEIQSLQITLFLDDDINDTTSQLIQDYLNERWVRLNPEVISVVIKDVGFYQEKLKQEQEKEKEKDALTFEQTWPWLLVLLLILAFVAILFFIRRKSESEIKPLNIDQKVDQKPLPENVTIEEMEKTKEQLIAEIIDTPLFSRGFLSTLDTDDQRKVINLFENQFIRELLASWMGTLSEIDEFDDIANRNDLVRILSELRDYKKVRQEQQSLPFGFLADLSEQELVKILQDENVTTIHLALSFLPASKVKLLLNQEEVKTQSDLVDNCLEEKETDPATFKEIETKLRTKYNEISSNLLLTQRSNYQMIEVILESSIHAPTLAQQLIDKQPALKDRLKKYLLSFDDLFKFKADEIRYVLENITNDTLLKIIASLGTVKREQLFKALSEERSKVLMGLAKSKKDVYQDDEVQDAKSVITRILRKYKFP